MLLNNKLFIIEGYVYNMYTYTICYSTLKNSLMNYRNNVNVLIHYNLLVNFLIWNFHQLFSHEHMVPKKFWIVYRLAFCEPKTHKQPAFSLHCVYRLSDAKIMFVICIIQLMISTTIFLLWQIYVVVRIVISYFSPSNEYTNYYDVQTI